METKELTLNEYQKAAMTTCMPSSNNFAYMMLNLVGEVGEFSSKVAKSIRKEHSIIGGKFVNEIATRKEFVKEERVELRKEAGDILWQLAGLCTVMDWDLNEVAQENLDKLQARKAEGTIDGNGDGVTKEERNA